MNKQFLTTLLSSRQVIDIFFSLERSRLLAISFLDDDDGFVSLCYTCNAGRNLSKGPLLDIRSHDVTIWRQSRYILVHERLTNDLWRVPTTLVSPTSGLQLNNKIEFLIATTTVVNEEEIADEIKTGTVERTKIADLLSYIDEKKDV